MRIGNGKRKDPRTKDCICEFCWKFKREPRLGRNHLSVIEALADSGKQFMIHKNYEMASDRLNRILKICHSIINSYPATPDYPRCRTKDESGNGKCNLPLKDQNCSIHGDQFYYDWEKEFEEVIS